MEIGESSKRRKMVDNFYPTDILFKIFVLLPFQAVKACQLVCKHWNDVIKDPIFVTRYQHNGSLVVLLDDWDLYAGLISHDRRLPFDPTCTIHRIPTAFKKLTLSDTGRHELLPGWSLGNMVCVKTSTGIFRLYNLFTRDRLSVRPTNKMDQPKNWILYGFGYDRFENDYKIFVVIESDPEDILDAYYWVYSYKNRCWTSIFGFPFYGYSWWRNQESLSCVCYSFNGVLYSLVHLNDYSLKRVIVTYDLHTRKFDQMSLPTDGARCDMGKLSEFDRKICYTYWLLDDWILEVCDHKGQWTKVMRIDGSISTDHLMTFYKLEYGALYQSNNGTRVGLLACQGKLKWYNYVKGDIKTTDADETWRAQRRRKRLAN